jgi:hypothetical protein
VTKLVKIIIRPKKIPVVPVSYRENIRVGRSEIIFFLNIFSWFWRFFAGRFAVESPDININ